VVPSALRGLGTGRSLYGTAAKRIRGRSPGKGGLRSSAPERDGRRRPGILRALDFGDLSAREADGEAS
jgi:hypothetical protein